VKLALEIGIVVTSVLLVVLVLLHRGKGGGLSSLFGGGVQSSLSGSSVVERNLDRMTIVVGVLWVILIIAMELHIKLNAKA
jgi:preprotein translocase subunit SecG